MKDKDKVLFCLIGEHSEVIALFPDMKEGHQLINSYMHIGQHSSASEILIKELIRASQEQYKSLANELKAIGYNLYIIGENDTEENENDTELIKIDSV